jgi:hypothetical protein
MRRADLEVNGKGIHPECVFGTWKLFNAERGHFARASRNSYQQFCNRPTAGSAQINIINLMTH